MNLPEFSVNRRVTISMMIMIILLFGIISFFQLGLDLMPEMEFPILTIMTKYEGVAAEDVEQLVTRPLEEVISRSKGIKKVTSTSEEGMSIILAEFKWGTNLDFAGQDIRENISQMSMFLPEDMDDPMVLKQDMSQMPVVISGVTGMKNTQILKKYLKDNIIPRLERIEGVAGAMIFGGLDKEINIYIDKSRLETYNISMDQLMGALYMANKNTSGGYARSGHQEYLVRTVGEFADIGTIGETVVGSSGMQPIRVKDIARIENSYKERRHNMRLNERDAVILLVTKQSGSNTVKVIRSVDKVLEDLRPTMPKDIRFKEVIDQASLIESATSNTTRTALIGGLLAVVILFFFLRNWRPTITIAIAIPISIITSFIGLRLFDYTFNMITIAGFALAVGMLIDNAVVVIENIYRHLEEGKTRNEAAKTGATEVGMAITASTLTTMAVFVPMALGGGVAGQITQPLAVTICVGLIASLLVAITIVPMIASVIFKKRTKEEYAATHGTKGFKAIQTMYGGILRWALRHRVVVLLIVFLLFVGSLAGAWFLGAEFMAGGDNGMAIFTVKLPVGTNLEETDRIASVIEKTCNKIPEADAVIAMVGPGEMGSGGGGFGASDVNEAMFMMRFKQKPVRKRSSEEIVDDLRNSLPALYDVEVNFLDMSNSMGGNGESPVEVKFFGKDLDVLKEKANIAMGLIGDVKGLRDLNITMREGKPELRIIPDREKAAAMGLSMSDVGEAVRKANLGQVVTRYRDKGDEVDVRIRLDERDRYSVDDIRTLPVVSRMGMSTPVANVADVMTTEGPIKIMRENRIRKVSLTANIKGRDVGSIVADIRERIDQMEMPSGYFIEYGGSYQQMQNSMRDLFYALIIAVILIYMIMAAQFESFTQPLVIMVTVPLAFIGVVAGLGITGYSISVPAVIGFIMLAGIVVNNGIVMLSYVNQLEAEGMEKKEALIHAATIRLRPILITSLTTIMGVFPMAISRSQGSEMSAPIGISVGFGLLFSTMLTLIVVPVLDSIAEGISTGLKNGLKKVVLGHEKA
ncbi:MAG: efflux RND transporter permease subunit [Chitinispirillaceae bacterium]|nr:efflux RND transporter permease subunit [Chitinispirillaceae bacterium]